MFGKSKRPSKNGGETTANSPKGPITFGVPVFFGLLFVLSIAELGFTVDSFIYLQRKHKWYSNTERARLGFLIFSAARTIALSGVYVGFHFARKHFHSMFHTVFVVMSTILWVVSGVLIHTMWGYFQCGGVGKLSGGLSECHEIKIIEILAWVIAAVSVLSAIPVVMDATKRRKRQAEAKKNAHSG